MAETQSSLADTAYARIRDKILGGQYTMGAPLSRRPLATELGMSFIPITEALQRLRRDGLVESKPRSGTRVRIPSAGEILGQYVVREALETQAARLFAELAGARQKRELAKAAKHVDALFASPPAARM